MCSLDVTPFLPHTNLEAGREHNALSHNAPKALVNNIHFINFLVGKWGKLLYYGRYIILLPNTHLRSFFFSQFSATLVSLFHWLQPLLHPTCFLIPMSFYYPFLWTEDLHFLWDYSLSNNRTLLKIPQGIVNNSFLWNIIFFNHLKDFHYYLSLVSALSTIFFLNNRWYL